MDDSHEDLKSKDALKICLMDESHENLKSKDALKILEMEANTYPNESSESYIYTRHTYKHKCLCMLFRFSVLFTN